MLRVCRFSQNPEEGTGFLSAGVIGDCELFNMGVGNGIWFLWKSSKCSQSMRHISIP